MLRDSNSLFNFRRLICIGRWGVTRYYFPWSFRTILSKKITRKTCICVSDFAWKYNDIYLYNMNIVYISMAGVFKEWMEWNPILKRCCFHAKRKSEFGGGGGNVCFFILFKIFHVFVIKKIKIYTFFNSNL